MSEQTYKGSCHCGKVQYEVTADISTVMTCNCSMCSRKGYMLIFITPEQLNVISGADEQTDYQIAPDKVHHYFCPTCGVTCYGAGKLPSGKQAHAVNVRTLEGVDLESLEIKKIDGKSF